MDSSESAAQWFGPKGFSLTIHQMDVRPGGVWRFIMHGPDGTDYNNRVEYIEVVDPERLVYDHGSDEEPDQFRATITFEEQDGKTKLTMHSLFKTAEGRDKAAEFGAIEGGTIHDPGSRSDRTYASGMIRRQPAAIRSSFQPSLCAASC